MEWEIKDMRETEYFLRMWVQQDLTLGMIWLTQCPYWECIISHFNLENITLRNIPFPTEIILDNKMSPKTKSERNKMNNKPYYPTLAQSCGDNSQCIQIFHFWYHSLPDFKPTQGSNIGKCSCMSSGTLRIHLTMDWPTYSHDFDLTPSAFVDTDYGGCRDTCHSTSGYVFTMAGEPSLGAASNCCALYCQKQNMLLCLNVHNRWHICTAG